MKGMTDAKQLLRDYTENGSEAAFRELVARYINLVYSVAVRRAGDDLHLAEDIVQTVFTDLARKGRTLRHESMLGGWLHRHACFVSSTLMRGERRRVECRGCQPRPWRCGASGRSKSVFFKHQCRRGRPGLGFRQIAPDDRGRGQRRAGAECEARLLALGKREGRPQEAASVHALGGGVKSRRRATPPSCCSSARARD